MAVATGAAMPRKMFRHAHHSPRFKTFGICHTKVGNPHRITAERAVPYHAMWILSDIHNRAEHHVNAYPAAFTGNLASVVEEQIFIGAGADPPVARKPRSIFQSHPQPPFGVYCYKHRHSECASLPCHKGSRTQISLQKHNTPDMKVGDITTQTIHGGGIAIGIYSRHKALAYTLFKCESRQYGICLAHGFRRQVACTGTCRHGIRFFFTTGFFFSTPRSAA